MSFELELLEIVGERALVSDASGALDPYLTEWRGRSRGKARAIVEPATVAMLQAVVHLCVRHRVAIVPQGGNTGLCGGAIPDESGHELLLSLKRLDQIEAVDVLGRTMTVQAGCTLAKVREAAALRGLSYPVSLASEGSATIGGTIATNAGGINVVSHGTTRAQVLGLEVVLANGELWNGLRSVRKNTAGYDLKHLFIGSEGTLGIVTRATLSLVPQSRSSVHALLSIPDIDAAISLLSVLSRRIGERITAFELFSDRALEFVLRHVPGTRRPLAVPSDYCVLLSVESAVAQDLTEVLTTELAAPDVASLLSDGVVARSLKEADEFWRLRHSISAAQKFEGMSLKHDISVPVSALADFHRAALPEVQSVLPAIRPVIFGHVGDGNLHYNFSRPEDMSDHEFSRFAPQIADKVHAAVRQFGGSISAEHGIGVFKRDLLETSLSNVELQMMRGLKSQLDPHGLLNPGKVLNS